MTETFFEYDEALDRLDGDEEFLVELLNELVEQVDENMPEIKTAIETKDYTTLRGAAHGIKGAAANLNVGPMADVFKELEILGQDESVEGAELYFDQAAELNEKLREFLKKF